MAHESILLNSLAQHQEAIGFWAGSLTTVAYAPQVVKTWKVGGQGLSWTTLMLFGAGVGLWLVYGIVRESEPIVLANALTGIQVLVILGLKMWHARKRSLKASTAD